LARFLAIDWEQQQLHVVQASTGRGGARVEQALTWSLPEPLTAAAAEGLGRKLREALKEANVAPAPVLVCVGRERVILKELRYPAVPESEEPNIVRFQAAKELTESPEDSVIDYTPMGNGHESGERHALAVVVRKEVVNSLKGLCQGLGMKLLAVTPRPAAVIGALDRSRQGKVPVGAVEALLVIGTRWADLAILRGRTLLFARSLGVGATLAAEVKRSLTVFNAGADAPAQSLFVASDGDETVLCDRLEQSLGLPVKFLDSFLPGDAVQVDKARRGRFTAAIGLLQRWSEKPELGINFIAPKEPKVAKNPRIRQKVLAAVMGAVVLVFMIVLGNMVLAGKKDKIRGMEDERTGVEDNLKSMAQLAVDIGGVKEWNNTSVSCLNLLYDLTAQFPSQKGFRINSIAVVPATKKLSKDKYIASVQITGVAPPDKPTLVDEFVAKINKTGTMRASVEGSKIGENLQSGHRDFVVRIDLMHVEPEKYTLKITRPPRPAQQPGQGPPGQWPQGQWPNGDGDEFPGGGFNP
jgi:Tfp pilus assembly PilM family ATPase